VPGGGIRVEGLREKVRALEAFGVEVDDLKDAFQEISQEASHIAAGYVQSKTGQLEGTVRGNRAKSRATVTAGRASVPYAGAQNYGWPRRNIKAQGFFAKTDERMQSKAPALLERGINDAIRRHGL
jgi:hypothetical protein